jgi:SAM-dependent methyltransferase
MERTHFFAACPVCSERSFGAVVAYEELRFVRCQSCELIYKKEHAAALAKREYDESYFRFNRAQYMKRWNHRVRKCRNQVLQCLEYAPAATRLLDIGCSAGYVLEGARRAGIPQATGLDLSKFAVDMCRQRGFAAEVGSLLDMPFENGAFDIVTLKHTLEHVADPMRALAEIRRVLAPGGVAFIVVPDAAYYKIKLMPRSGRSFRPDRRGWQHHVYFYQHNLLDACKRSGLVPLKLGKDIFRRRLAHGPRSVVERLRYYWMLFWTHGARLTHLRREIQVIAQKPRDESAWGHET